MRIAFITDVEGSLPFFRQAVAISPLLSFDVSNNLIFLHDDAHFVFGGDLMDKGPHDNELCRLLVHFKRNHFDRVHLILGNRDLNKLRFAAELSDADLARHPSMIPKPHWDSSVPTFQEYLLQELAKDESSEDVESINTRTNRLKYMLLYTLGCPGTFEFRRQEISIETGRTLDEVNDEEVTNNFYQSVIDSKSLFRQFLAQGCIAVRLGDTIFIHGALDANTAGWVPDNDTKFEMPQEKASGTLVRDVDVWIERMNQYLKEGLIDFNERPDWNETFDSRGGESLMALQNRDAMWGRSVVSNCFSDGACITTQSAATKRKEQYQKGEIDPSAFAGVYSDPFDSTMIEWLLQSGVRRQVVGHKPSGDCPAVLAGRAAGSSGGERSRSESGSRSGGGGGSGEDGGGGSESAAIIEIVSADTSFSDVSSLDNRGCAVSYVTVHYNEERNTSHVVIGGILHDGSEHGVCFPTLGRSGKEGTSTDWIGDPHVGKRLPSVQCDDDENDVRGEWWVQTKDKEQYRCVRGAGRQWETKMVKDVRSLL